ncbi:24244_t:CDS:1, partial [Racocetra persica]
MSNEPVQAEGTSQYLGKQWLERAIKEGLIRCIDYGRFQKIKDKSEGGFGKVSSAELISGGIKLTVALKSIKSLEYSQNDDNEKGYKEFIKE